MPYGMGRAGWYAWPQAAFWMRYGPPWYPAAYWPPFQPWTKEEEKAMLEDQVEILEGQLSQIKKRLEELEKEEKEKK